MNSKGTTEPKEDKGQRRGFLILWLIPILMLGYIGWQNLAPLGSTISYVIDLGGEDTSGKAIIAPPYDRLSDRKAMQGIGYRELEKKLVYFTVDDPKLSSASEISVRIRFKDNFPGGGSFILGAKNTREGDFSWQESYVPFYNGFNGFPLISSDKRSFLYAVKPEVKSDFQNLDDFLKHPPFGSIIATNDKSLNVNQLTALWEMPGSGSVSAQNSNFVSISGFSEEENGTFSVNASLRGGHTFWTYVNDGYLDLKVTKQDLNWYEKPDEMSVEVYSSHQELKGRVTIPDDGEAAATKSTGLLQEGVLQIADLEPGAYRIELKGGSDILIRSITINQEKLVIAGNVFLIGTNRSYFQDGRTSYPVNLYTQALATGQVKFRTSHKSGLQQVIIRGNELSTVVDINELNADFVTSIVAGSYQLTFPVQDVLIEHGGYFSFTPDSFFVPQRCQVIDLKYDIAWLKENADYLLISLDKYIPPEEDDGWLITQATWKREDLFINNNILSFCLNVPHLAQSDEFEKTIPVDWIEVTLKIPPLNKR